MPTPTLDLRTLLVGDVNRLRYIHRFGTALTLHKENVAEHSFYVAIYAYFISLYAIEAGHGVDLANCLERALVHDLEESRTGDFPRPFKYRRPELKAMLDEAAADEVRIIVADIVPENAIASERVRLAWDTAREVQTHEGCIVAFADFLSVVSHLWQEVNCSNVSMYDHYQSVMDYQSEFDKECFDFLRPIVEDAKDVTREIFHSYIGVVGS